MSSDVQVAQEIAQAVGVKVMELQRAAGPVDFDDRAEILRLKDQGDAVAQVVVDELLAKYRPADGLLSEEKPDSIDRLSQDRVWIIDPVDGTSNFGYRGTEFAVQIALWERGRGLTAAALGIPAQDRVLLSEPTKAFALAPRTEQDPVRFITSRSHPPAVANDLDLLREFFAEQGVSQVGAQVGARSSVGVKVLALIDGEADVYVHDSGFNEWDAAAPQALAVANGFVVSRIDGSEVEYNKRDPKVADFVVCRPELHPVVIDLLAR